MQYSPTSQHSLTHFLPNTLQHTLFCHLVLLAVAERLHNLGSGASKTLARWIVMNFLTFVSSVLLRPHILCSDIFFQRSACRLSFGYNICSVHFFFFLFLEKTSRTSSSTKITFHQRFYFFFLSWAQKLSPRFSLLIKNVTEPLEPPVSECTARQYHARFNVPALFSGRIMVLASYKNQHQTQRSQNNSAEKNWNVLLKNL